MFMRKQILWKTKKVYDVMTYLVTRGHTHEKVKPVFIKIGKTTRSECRRKKEQLSSDK